MDLIRWEDDSGVTRQLKIYKRTAHKWKVIAIRLGLQLGEIESIERNYNSNDFDRVTAVLKHWFDNATNLPNASRYPKSWPGLIQLLEDAELGEVAKELHTALSSARNDVKGNMYQ